jgi:hypothetical protein
MKIHTFWKFGIRKSLSYAITVILLSMTLMSQTAVDSLNLVAEAFGDEFKTKIRATFSEYKDGTKSVRIDYQSEIDSICYDGGSVVPKDLFITFVTELNGQPQYHTYKLTPFCPRSRAESTFVFDSKNGLSMPSWMGTSDPHIWDRLFPKNEKGERWFALRIGFSKSHMGSSIRYDNLGGHDYRLIFK